ncbi:disease resistance protein RPV1-like [Vicia villosa]|uniref:disease resistance protein RPV1-like n=1 Tax=Vicia villosa TaxID=3911 RepID=UPI00273B1880|nr:disease resistance protein RPV1-like [Vicia villosa]
MAWLYKYSASSSTSSSKNTPQENHEVFITFKSEDTGKTFTSHLNGALKRLNIKTYIGNNLTSGDEIPTSLVKVIEEAKLSIVVFSKNYAESKRCLKELMKILECNQTSGQIVVPVFFDVDDSNVRSQTGSYDEAFVKHEKNFEEKKKVQEWKKGLTEAANFPGWDCNVNRTELELVEEIAMDVLRKVDGVNVSHLDYEINQLDNLARLQYQFYESIPTLENLNMYNATVRRITEIKMDRSVRLLRLTPDLLSHLECFSNNNNRSPF